MASREQHQWAPPNMIDQDYDNIDVGDTFSYNSVNADDASSGVHAFSPGTLLQVPKPHDDSCLGTCNALGVPHGSHYKRRLGMSTTGRDRGVGLQVAALDLGHPIGLGYNFPPISRPQALCEIRAGSHQMDLPPTRLSGPILASPHGLSLQPGKACLGATSSGPPSLEQQSLETKTLDGQSNLADGSGCCESCISSQCEDGNKCWLGCEDQPDAYTCQNGSLPQTAASSAGNDDLDQADSDAILALAGMAQGQAQPFESMSSGHQIQPSPQGSYDFVSNPNVETDFFDTTTFGQCPLSSHWDPWQLQGHIATFHRVANPGHCQPGPHEQCPIPDLDPKCHFPRPDNSPSYGAVGVSSPREGFQGHECGMSFDSTHEFVSHIMETHSRQAVWGPGAATNAMFSGTSDQASLGFSSFAHWLQAGSDSKMLQHCRKRARSTSESSESEIKRSRCETEKMVSEVASTPTACLSSQLRDSSKPRGEKYICVWCEAKETPSCCREEFDSPQTLWTHVKNRHSGKNSARGEHGFRCGWEGCSYGHGKGFTSKSKLDRHVSATHCKVKSFKCKTCGQSFSSKQALDTHENRHTGKKPFVCDWPGCGKTFAQPTAKSMHMRTHTGEKPLRCDICGKGFSESSNLSKHKKTHQEEKGFHCHQDGCTKSFKRKDQLKKHLQSHENRRRKQATSEAPSESSAEPTLPPLSPWHSVDATAQLSDARYAAHLYT